MMMREEEVKEGRVAVQGCQSGGNGSKLFPVQLCGCIESGLRGGTGWTGRSPKAVIVSRN